MQEFNSSNSAQYERHSLEVVELWGVRANKSSAVLNIALPSLEIWMSQWQHHLGRGFAQFP